MSTATRGAWVEWHDYRAFQGWLFQLTARLYAAMTDFLSGKLDGVKAVLGGELMVWFSGSMAGSLQKNEQTERDSKEGGATAKHARARVQLR